MILLQVPDLPIQDQMNLSKSNPDLSTTTHASTNVSHSSLRIERMTPTRPSQLSKSVHSTPTHGLSSAPTFSFHSLDDSNNNHSLIETNKQEQFVDAAMRGLSISCYSTTLSFLSIVVCAVVVLAIVLSFLLSFLWYCVFITAVGMRKENNSGCSTIKHFYGNMDFRWN